MEKAKKLSFMQGGTTMGHGFVLRYFYQYTLEVWMKRWRCPDCGPVHTARSCEYPAGFQYSKDIIERSLETRVEGKPFVEDITRQNQ